LLGTGQTRAIQQKKRGGKSANEVWGENLAGKKGTEDWTGSTPVEKKIPREIPEEKRPGEGGNFK